MSRTLLCARIDNILGLPLAWRQMMLSKCLASRRAIRFIAQRPKRSPIRRATTAAGTWVLLILRTIHRLGESFPRSGHVPLTGFGCEPFRRVIAGETCILVGLEFHQKRVVPSRVKMCASPEQPGGGIIKGPDIGEATIPAPAPLSSHIMDAHASAHTPPKVPFASLKERAFRGRWIEHFFRIWKSQLRPR